MVATKDVGTYGIGAPGIVGNKYLGVDSTGAPKLFNELRRVYAFPGIESLRAVSFGNSFVEGANGMSFVDESINQTAKLAWIANRGVGGNTSAQILARIGTLPSDTQVCVFGEGPNDADNGVTVAQHRANMEAIIQTLLASNILPVMYLSSPRNSYGQVITGYVAAELALASKYGVSAYDPWKGFIVDTATGEPASGSTTDGVHPTFANFSTAASAFAAYMNGTNPDTPFGPRSNVAGPSGYCLWGANGLNLTDTNADGVPDGWSLGGSATPTTPAAPTGYLGKMARMTSNSAGGVADLIGPTISSGWMVGDELLFTCIVRSTGTTQDHSVAAYLNYDGSSHAVVSSSVAPFSTKRIVRRFTPTTTNGMFFYTELNNTTTGSVIEVGELEIYNLTALLSR